MSVHQGRNGTTLTMTMKVPFTMELFLEKHSKLENVVLYTREVHGTVAYITFAVVHEEEEEVHVLLIICNIGLSRARIRL